LLPASINPRILELLRRCLDRNPKNRWQAAGDLRAQLNLVIPERTFAFGFVLSPDGSTLAFENGDKLWVRAIDGDAAQPVAGTDSVNGGSLFPFWSPDSKSIGFFADNKMKRVDLATSSVRTIADLPGWAGNGGTWNRDGVIVFGSSSAWAAIDRINGRDIHLTNRTSRGHSCRCTCTRTACTSLRRRFRRARLNHYSFSSRHGFWTRMVARCDTATIT